MKKTVVTLQPLSGFSSVNTDCIHNYSPQIESLNIRQKLDYILQGVEHNVTLQCVFFLDKLYKLINKKEVDLKKN